MIAIYPGSFNPFHKGHYDRVKEIITQRNLRKIKG